MSPDRGADPATGHAANIYLHVRRYDSEHDAGSDFERMKAVIRDGMGSAWRLQFPPGVWHAAFCTLDRDTAIRMFDACGHGESIEPPDDLAKQLAERHLRLLVEQDGFHSMHMQTGFALGDGGHLILMNRPQG